MDFSQHPEGEPAQPQAPVGEPAHPPAPVGAPSQPQAPVGVSTGPVRDPRPHVWPAFVAFGATLLAAQIISLIVLVPMLVVHLLRSEEDFLAPDELIRRLPSIIATPWFIVAAAACSSLTITGSALVGVRLSKQPVKVRLRLGPSNIGIGKILLASLGVVAISWLLGALISVLGLDKFGVLGLFDGAFKKATPGMLALSFFFVGLVGPCGEEMFFRGFMQTRLAQRWSRWGAITMTAAAFGLMHMDPIQSPFAMLVGLYLGWLTERTGSIRPAIAAHAVNNCFSVAAARYLGGDVPTGVAIGQIAGSLVVLAAAVLVLRERAPRQPAAPPLEQAPKQA